MIEAPIVFITYKRPKETQKILNIILKSNYSKLYIFQDGLNQKISSLEKRKFFKTRKIISNKKIKKVKLILFKKNIGLRYIADTLLKRVFQSESKAIILEDDTVPEKNFFSFCDILLKKYKKKKNISHISGCNLYYGTNKKTLVKESYFFSKFPQVWGWATWRDRWLQYYDPDIKSWPQKKNIFLKNCNLKTGEKRYFKYYLERIYLNRGPGWDQQWIFANILNNLKIIVPNKNLIKNIGYPNNPTGKSAKKFRNLFTKNIELPLKHCEKIYYNQNYDNFLYESFYNRQNLIKRIFKRVKTLLKQLIRYIFLI